MSLNVSGEATKSVWMLDTFGVPDRAVARPSDRIDRKLDVCCLQLLKAKDVILGLTQSLQKNGSRPLTPFR